MKRFSVFVNEGEETLPRLSWEKDPKIGWWGDHKDHLVMYHGTHDSRVQSISKEGIRAPSQGPTRGWVSMTHDPHTAHGYASMHGGESSFRAAGSKASHVPHSDRSVVVAHIPREWAEKNMNHELRGNSGDVRTNLSDRSKYEAHRASGKRDHEYYAKTELRFKDRVPPEFVKGYMKKPI